VPSSYTGQANKIVKVNGAANGLTFGTLAFVGGLSDTPASYTGAGGKFVQVNSGATGLQFGAPKVSDLSDGPGAFTSNALKVVRVNAGTSALEYHAMALIDLIGFPAAYTGAGGKFLQVKVDESGLQFVSSSVTTNFLALTDTPTSYAGQANRAVVVDPTASGLVFGAIVPTRLGHLADVEDGTGTPSQGSFLRWIDGVWQADVYSPGAGVTSFAALTDGPGALTGHSLQLVRVNTAATALEYYTLPMIPTRLGQLADVEDGTGTPAENAVLTWKNGVWQAEPGAPTSLALLTDVDESTPPTDGQALVFNGTAGKWKPATISTGGGSGISVYYGTGAPSTTHTDNDLYFDTSQLPYAGYVQHAGTWEPFGPPGLTFDVALYVESAPTASERLLRLPISRNSTFAGNFSGSYANASTAATGSTVFDVRKNGSSVGSITFAASGTTATFTTTSGAAVTFSAGDYLEIIAPNTPDATLKEIGFSLKGVRN
jgi:hypothetical protein